MRVHAPGRTRTATRDRGRRSTGRPGHAVLDLQRTAGNRATAELVQRRKAGGDDGRPVTVQRHSSFEHALLGDTKPEDLGKAAVTEKDRKHVIEQQLHQTMFFWQDAKRDPRARYPDVRWIQLEGSSLWVSYGELNALADYLPDAGNIDSLREDVVLPVLQRMRAGIIGQTSSMLANFTAGQAESGGWEMLPGPAGEVKALDKATASLGTNRYMSLVARNACHFAPMSWQRWSQFHETALEHARAYHRRQGDQVALETSVANSADEDVRQAWLNAGYGDHFLQDSFAAGHLVNKTLVMQWFVDYLNGMASKWWDLLGPIVWWGADDTQPWYGMPSDAVMESMGEAQQPGMAGRELYGRPPDGRTVEEDRVLGSDVRDPQTAQERDTRDQRIAGSGVQATGSRSKEQAYAAYLEFLNSSFLQLAAGTAHDHLNEHGLVVGNERGDVMHVGGDDTLLTKSGKVGAEVAGEASQRSRQSIDETLRTGSAKDDVATIWQLIPTYVFQGETKISLGDWQDEVLHDLCRREIFPDVVDSGKSKVVRAASTEMSDSGIEMDGVRAPGPVIPPDGAMGDWVIRDDMANMG